VVLQHVGASRASYEWGQGIGGDSLFKVFIVLMNVWWFGRTAYLLALSPICGLQQEVLLLC
jgi:hypothetical protein